MSVFEDASPGRRLCAGGRALRDHRAHAASNSPSARAPGEGGGEARLIASERIIQGDARPGHEHALRPQHPAGDRSRRQPADRRSDHARRPLVVLSAAQARSARAEPEESALEEIYYHRLNPPQGFAFQRVYTDDRSLDETVSVEDGDVVMVPRGYHPVGAPHGYDLYYLNVMAGPKRTWIFSNDPAHAWIAKKK